MHYGEPQENVPAFSLTIISGGESGQRFVFAQPEVTIGRIADNDLVLYDAAVSRRHLVFYFRNNQFILEDLGSSNGSQLNGGPITQPTVLCEQDILDVGSVRFRFSSDNVDEYDDNDDPTEIELDPDYSAIPEEPGPLVRARWEAGNGGPLPPEGDTRQFPAHQIRGAQQPIPAPGASPNVSLGPAAGAMPNPGATMDPQAFAKAAPRPTSQPLQAGPQRPLHTGMGIQPPSHPPPQSAQPASQPAAPAYSPSSPHYPAAPSQPRMPGAQPLHLPQQGHLAGLDSPRPGVMGRQDQQFQMLERRRVRNASLWSFAALLAVVALFFIPLRKRAANINKSPTARSRTEPILYNNAISSKVYGYNKKDESHPTDVVIQFFYRGGRVNLVYRVSAPRPVKVMLNGSTLASVEPLKKSWHYNRHHLPRNQLRPQSYNQVIFQIQSKAQKIWGVTSIKIEEIAFPPASYPKAKIYCDLGQKHYKQRDKQPELRHKAIGAFQKCKDYLTLGKVLLPLYKEADLMISQINRQLDLMLHQKLLQARRLKSIAEKQKIYRALQKFFPDKADPRHQKVTQLESKSSP